MPHTQQDARLLRICCEVRARARLVALRSPLIFALLFFFKALLPQQQRGILSLQHVAATADELHLLLLQAREVLCVFPQALLLC